MSKKKTTPKKFTKGKTNITMSQSRLRDCLERCSRDTFSKCTSLFLLAMRDVTGCDDDTILKVFDTVSRYSTNLSKHYISLKDVTEILNKDGKFYGDVWRELEKKNQEVEEENAD